MAQNFTGIQRQRIYSLNMKNAAKIATEALKKARTEAADPAGGLLDVTADDVTAASVVATFRAAGDTSVTVDAYISDDGTPENATKVLSALAVLGGSLMPDCENFGDGKQIKFAPSTGNYETYLRADGPEDTFWYGLKGTLSPETVDLLAAQAGAGCGTPHVIDRSKVVYGLHPWGEAWNKDSDEED